MSSMSPRLPSPPPPAEIQIGPKSPGLSATADEEAQQMEQIVLQANSKRRIHPGTKSADMAAGPPLVPLNELDSAFQLQEHLAALHYHHTAHNTQPITRETAALLAEAPPSIDRNLWLYELCRFLISQCNSLIVGFLFDTPPCSYNTCPEMRASEWQFLCAVHEQPKSCCAIDYCCHTLDWAANVVTNPKLFPSRFVAPGSDASGHDKGAAVKNLVNVFRRLHRIFAHAWFQHRGVFWNVEGQTGLYVFFKTVCDTYDTLPAENYKLPPEAEGLESVAAGGEGNDRGAKKDSLMPAPTILQRSEDDSHLLPSRTNTRRHIRGSPSTGSAVTTVLEAEEDEDTDVTGKFGELRITTPDTLDEEPEVAEVPVIVEHGMMEEARSSSDSTAETPTARLEDRRHEKPTVSEKEVKAEDEPESDEPKSEPAEGENVQAQEPETTLGTQGDGQNEEPKDEDVHDSAESKTLSSATDEAAIPADTSIHDFAHQAEDGPSETTGEDTTVKDPDAESKENSPSEEAVVS
ncbi:hypothetical protein N0V82_008819 [Gnomoniopsis sp. IMI 355080]|nr:hypothetical protein N0V82_008819 [Gnomoniopsis sp. IMI 355080]